MTRDSGTRNEHIQAESGPVSYLTVPLVILRFGAVGYVGFRGTEFFG